MDQTTHSGNESSDQKTITREQLYDAIWSEPAMHLAAKYGVSGSFLARVCDRLRVPRPRPGYWNKLAVGKAPPKPALPEAEPGDELQWCPADTPPAPPRAPRTPNPPKAVAPVPTPDHDPNADAAAPTDQETQKPGPRSPLKRVPATHPLIEGVVGLIPEGKTTEEGYYRPRKRLLPDLITSPKQLDTIVRLANKLYRLLEARGHRVRMANNSDHFHRHNPDPFPPTKQRGYHDGLWRPERPTVVYIDSIAIGLSLFELCESVEMQYVRGEYVPVSQISRSTKTLLGNHTWTTQKLVPSGEFCLQAYSPYSGTSWSQQWRGKSSALSGELGDIVATLETHPSTIRHLIEEARLAAEKRAREWEEEKQRYILEEQAKRRAKALEASHTELLAIIEEWNERKRIAAFFEEAMAQAAQVSEDAKGDIEQRLAAAKKLLEVADALTRLKHWRSPEEIYELLPKSHWEKD
ncbi:hypothetical protein MID00_16245 [Alcaligenes sp. NLF5-7]|uniref:hypothetical protein n=1 Tax=Alcaligenes sp. NLF5-7 TaxID=2918755 RepID=UPI0020C3AE48|nr:hypothetical protein [Alcaligenes sp. NLF5-7]UTM01028.1 hypothetical protein MID00_16245 [Alcaligenes sp. NLF5-7]